MCPYASQNTMLSPFANGLGGAALGGKGRPGAWPLSSLPAAGSIYSASAAPDAKADDLKELLDMGSGVEAESEEELCLTQQLSDELLPPLLLDLRELAASHLASALLGSAASRRQAATSNLLSAAAEAQQLFTTQLKIKLLPQPTKAKKGKKKAAAAATAAPGGSDGGCSTCSCGGTRCAGASCTDCSRAVLLPKSVTCELQLPRTAPAAEQEQLASLVEMLRRRVEHLLKAQLEEGYSSASQKLLRSSRAMPHPRSAKQEQ